MKRKYIQQTSTFESNKRFRINTICENITGKRKIRDSSSNINSNTNLKLKIKKRKIQNSNYDLNSKLEFESLLYKFENLSCKTKQDCINNIYDIKYKPCAVEHKIVMEGHKGRGYMDFMESCIL